MGLVGFERVGANRLPAPSAGKPADETMLVNVPRLITAYYSDRPDPSVPSQRVVFGTSGHRGSAFEKAFNEWHILAITQAICLYRAQNKIDGPLFLGMDTHALSVPALTSALEVLAANRVDVMLSQGDEYTPRGVTQSVVWGLSPALYAVSVGLRLRRVQQAIPSG
jgi:phosphoglucomutase